MNAYTVRPYRGESDLHRMQTLCAESVQQAGKCGYLHVGDIPHRIYNLLRRQPIPDPARFVRLWEDSTGTLVGWALCYPQWGAFDAQIHASHRGGALEQQVISDAETTVLEIMRLHKITPGEMATDVYEGDIYRAAALESRGYQRGAQVDTMCWRSLKTPIPDPTLQDGYSIRSAAGTHEAGALGAVHNGAFGSNWTAAEYREVMESPGYSVKNELVVVAPNGAFAAFTVNWMDTRNRIMLFEPVGTHQDFQRKGLGRALLHYAMRRGRALGMEKAEVLFATGNAAAETFYLSVGFEPQHALYSYARSL